MFTILFSRLASNIRTLQGFENQKFNVIATHVSRKPCSFKVRHFCRCCLQQMATSTPQRFQLSSYQINNHATHQNHGDNESDVYSRVAD